MEYIQCNLGPDIGYTHRSGYHLDVTRHVLVNIRGKRFVAEDGARDYLRDAVLQQPNKIVYSIVDKNGFQNLSSLFQQAGNLGEIEGEHFESNDLAELAKKMKRFLKISSIPLRNTTKPLRLKRILTAERFGC